MSCFNFTTLYASSDYSTNVTYTIPASYTVLLDIGKHGKVIINNEVYDYRHKSVEVKRMTEQKYIIQPDSGWQIKDVVYTKMEMLNLCSVMITSIRQHLFKIMVTNCMFVLKKNMKE